MNNIDIGYYRNGQKQYEIYYNYKNVYHREDGPAYNHWLSNGQKYYEIYYRNGQKHREDGPAYNKWNENGQKVYEEYWINDKKLN